MGIVDKDMCAELVLDRLQSSGNGNSRQGFDRPVKIEACSDRYGQRAKCIIDIKAARDRYEDFLYIAVVDQIESIPAYPVLHDRPDIVSPDIGIIVKHAVCEDLAPFLRIFDRSI